MPAVKERLYQLIAGYTSAWVADSSVGLRTITTGNGYSQTVNQVNVPPHSVAETLEYPAVNVIEREVRTTHVLAGAVDVLITLELQCLTQEYVETQRTLEIERLMADVIDLAQTDETWGGLARRTKVVSTGPSPFQSSEPMTVMAVVFNVWTDWLQANPFLRAML